MKKILLTAFVALPLLLCGLPGLSQSQPVVTLTADMFDDDQVIFLGNLDGWFFKPGHDPAWAGPELNIDDWERLRPADLTFDYADESTVFEGWFRMSFRIDSTLANIPLYWRSGTFGAIDLYLDGELIYSYGKPSADFFSHRSYNPFNRSPNPAYLEPDRDYLLAFHLVDHHSAWEYRLSHQPARIDPMLRITGPEYVQGIQEFSFLSTVFHAIWLTALFMLTVLFWTISIKAKNDVSIRLITWLNTLLFLSVVTQSLTLTVAKGFGIPLLNLLFSIITYTGLGLVPMVISQILDNEIPDVLKRVFIIYVALAFVAFWAAHFAITAFLVLLIILISGYYMFKSWEKLKGSTWFVAGGLMLTAFWILLFALYNMQAEVNLLIGNSIITLVNLTLPFSLLLYVSVRFNEVLTATRNKSREIAQLSREKIEVEKERQRIIENQKILLEKEVEERTKELRQSLKNLEAAQEQLVQQEKLASLGQLTAGIAHEIKNPLNFVNNFSEVSLELIGEARDEVKNSPLLRGESEGGAEARGVSDGEGDHQHNSDTDSGIANTPLNPLSRGDLLLEILDDIEANLRKIHEHGTRADGIVKSMLMHSRGGTGTMEPIKLNGLIKEYVNLAFHGMRAGKNPINVDIELDLDEKIGELPLIAEDFSRVILNLCNNAFDAMREKQGAGFREQGSGGLGAEKNSLLQPAESGEAERSRGVSSIRDYKPKLTVRTHQTENGYITIEIEDNGPGIPKEIQEKILQPFFTTKKGTEGTGLGLSITNDIVKAHGGELSLTSNPQIGTMFRIAFPNS